MILITKPAQAYVQENTYPRRFTICRLVKQMMKLSIEADPQFALFASTFVLLDINDFPRKLIKGLVNRYLDDATVYEIKMIRAWQLISMGETLSGIFQCL